MKIVGFEPKDNNIKLEDIIVDVHYDRQQRLYALCLRDKNTQNILSDYQYARDKKEAQFTKSMMQDDIRNYLDDSYTLIEELQDNDTFRFPDLQQAINYYWKDRDVHIEKVSIDQLVKDNNLLNDWDLESYHKLQWDNKPAKEFSIDKNKANNWRLSEVPYAVRHKDGKLELGDGRHRTRALYNDGYKFVYLPVINENMSKTNKNSLRNAFYQKDDNCITQEIKSENKGNLNEAFIQMNDRFKNLINDCVNTLTSNGINVPTDKIDFRTNDNIRRLGVAYYPKSENDSKYVIGLSNYMNDMNDEQVKNTIYHEIGHIIAYENDFKKGYVYIDNNGDTRVSGRTPREWGANKKKLSHHGKVWQDIMQSISKITGQSYQRLANAEDSAYFKSATNEKFPYQFECPNCHCKLRYSRKTDFVKNFDKVDNNGEPLWWCGTCKKKTGKKIAFVKLEGSE